MGYKATFLLGVPDSRMVKFNSVNKNGMLHYNMEGNGDFHNYLPIPETDKNTIILKWFAEPVRNLPKTDILINSITDADSTLKSLEIAGKITSFVKRKHPNIPIFNEPSKVLETTRDKIYKKYNALKGLYIPKVIRIKPESAAQVVELAKKQGLNYPFLMRPCGMHESKNLNLIKSKADNKLLERYAYDGTEYYLTEFVDYKSEDGLYRKARLLIIGGKICPRHYMTGEEWMVHGDLHEEYMSKHIETKKAEINFINNYRKMISEESLNSMMELYKRSGLDYLGFDFAIRPDKSILIFEINPAQNPFINLNPKHFPYMKLVRENIIRKLGQAVENKINIQRKNIALKKNEKVSANKK